MAVSNSRRLQAYESLEANLGSDAADTIMELLPIQPELELVTRTDMQASTVMLRGEMSELRGEMAELRAELRGEMGELRAELRGEMAELRVDLTKDMAELRTGLRSEMSQLRSDLTSEMSRRFDAQNRWGVALIGSNIAALVAAIAT